MAAGLSAITGITKDVVFSTRRADKAANADNVAVAVGNADIASGQIKNAYTGVERLLKESKSIPMTGFNGAANAISAISSQNAFLEGVGTVVNFTADHINPVIAAVGGVKVLTSDDKKSTFIEEAPAIGTMFAFEGAAKNILEMDKKVKDPVTGAKTLVKRKAFYKSNPFLKAQSEKMEKAINDYCDTKKLFNKISLKPLPAITKGLMFVGASIAGYETGKAIGKEINKARGNKTTAETAEKKPENTAKAEVKAA